MGCRCCRMIKSYIYDPSVAVDVRKTDSAGNSLYQPSHLPPGADSALHKQKQGFSNLGYSKSQDSTLRLEADNNHLNHKLHAAKEQQQHRQQSAALPGEAALYIIRPDPVKPRWVNQDPSQVPVYPQKHRRSPEETRRRAGSSEWDRSVDGVKTLSADEVDEGVGGTAEYPCDTGDEGSVLSVDIHTSSTSLSSADTKDEPPKTPDVSTLESGICLGKSEDEEEEEEKKRTELKEEEEEGEGEVRSVTDSMVAEALAALEAATAGEEFE